MPRPELDVDTMSRLRRRSVQIDAEANSTEDMVNAILDRLESVERENQELRQQLAEAGDVREDRDVLAGLGGGGSRGSGRF